MYDSNPTRRQEHCPGWTNVDIQHSVNVCRVLNPVVAPLHTLVDTLRVDIRAIYWTALKLSQAELENAAEIQAAGRKPGNNYSVTHPCLSCKLFALDGAAILKANLGVLQEKQISRSTLWSLDSQRGLCAMKSQCLAEAACGSRWTWESSRPLIFLRMRSLRVWILKCNTTLQKTTKHRRFSWHLILFWKWNLCPQKWGVLLS